MLLDARFIADLKRGLISPNDALETIYESEKGRVLAALRGLAGYTGQDDPEDLLQDVFVQVVRTWDRFVPSSVGELRVWLKEITISVVWDRRKYWRAKKRQPPSTGTHVDGEDAIDPRAWPPPQEETSDVVERGLQRLAVREQLVLRLRYVGGHSFADIATILGESSDAVRSAHHRAIVKLKRILRGEVPRS
ncbi:MAG: sigma-70 family RNA polymerase sigma factor [Planctomycetes bacterium]|nr:sigma-70 family RNA polymerase sigma factor [Planctomycetota bacterium]